MEKYLSSADRIHSQAKPKSDDDNGGDEEDEEAEEAAYDKTRALESLSRLLPKEFLQLARDSTPDPVVRH